MEAWITKVRRMKAEAARAQDPLRRKIETVLASADAMSTVALLQLVGMEVTTANGRVVARTMRSMGFVPIKSRRLAPGGFKDTTIRGWARPLRGAPHERAHTIAAANVAGE